MIRTALLAALFAPLLAAQEEAPKRIVVGAKNFTESEILQELMAQMFEEHTGAEVVRLKFQGTEICFGALKKGDIDVYAEYTGTGLRNILEDDAPIKGAADGYARVQLAFRKKWGMEWGAPFGLNNTYVLVMRRDHAEKLKIRKISDLKGHDLRFGGSHEFLARKDGIPGLQERYGLKILGAKGMAHDLAYKALEEGAIDLTDGYSTDGRLMDPKLILLEDDLRFFPPYEAAPLARGALFQDPEARTALSLLAGRLDDDTMRRLNFEVDVNRRDHKEVASEFLNAVGLRNVEIAKTSGQLSFPAFLWARKGRTLHLTGEHLLLTGLAVLLACLVGVPLGILAGRTPRLATWVLGIAGILQTVPSIALLAFMLPLFGVGMKPAIAALFLYGLLPILRNTVTGIKGIDPRLLEVGTGLGMTKSQLLWKVELPLAIPVILAGVRTSTVINIGTATLAAFIGAGGLGDEIVTGLARTDNNMIMAGALPAALLAVGMDALLSFLERSITPRGLKLKEA